MDTDLVGAYIDKQRDMVHDLMSRVIMSEAKESLLTKRFNNLQQQFEEISKNFEILKKDNTKLTTENCSMSKESLKMQGLINGYTLEILRLRTDTEQPKKKKVKSLPQKQQDSE
jgi:hypothetical protein